MTDLATIRDGWDHAARTDAMFNILTDAGRTNGTWTAEDFFAHGQVEIDAAIERLDRLGIDYATGRALDFGCGVGRLTQALTCHFRRVDGVDVSLEMVRRAIQHGLDRRARFHHNDATDLELFPAGRFDFVYSMLVLQHMPQPLQEGYVREFFRVLRPGGIAMFEIPEGPDTTHDDPWLSMYAVARETVEDWVMDATGEMLDVEVLDEPSQWNCHVFTAVKR